MQPPRSDHKSSTRISIAMATYNGERYLPPMLDSLAAQTVLPDELVVRDDGSTDHTVALLEQFAARAPFSVRSLPSLERLGYAQNFVAVGRECSGDLVFFADQDDVWRPSKLATVAEAAPDGEPSALFHDFALQDGEGAAIAPSFYHVLEQRGFGPEVAIKGCTIAITRAFIDLWGWPTQESRIPHDVWVALLSTAFDQRRELPDILIDHRLHDANTSGWIPDAESRAFTTPGDGSSALELLIDLLLKKHRLRPRTDALLRVLRERGELVDPRAARQLRRRLRAQRRRYRES